ncbi:MAG: hypothetical protein Q8N63_01675 [Nanoarchaeota archaeon]|nr:hypothetical protein [Nanoarchaeota archaeon]
MAEQLEHKKLKTKARELLKEKYGFKDFEIFEEYNYTLENSVKIRIDVVGKNANNFIAVECGNTSRLKEVCLRKEFGKEKVILLPYDKIILEPLFYRNPKTRNEKINLMKSIYNKYVYEKLKNDRDFSFFEYNDENKDYFYVGQKRDIWMAFPTKKNTINGRELQYEIGFTIAYRDDEHYEISIGAETNKSVKQFLDLSTTTKESITKELNKLPSSFEIQDGIKYKTEKVRMPPYLRNWELIEPIPCNQMTQEKLIEMEKRLSWYLEEGKKFEEYPVLEIIRITVAKEELEKVLLILKPLYELSFKFRTQKQEKAIHDSIKSLKDRIKLFEIGLDDESSEEDYYRWIEAVKEIEKKESLIR